MKICPQCGTKYSDETQSCWNCKIELEEFEPKAANENRFFKQDENSTYFDINMKVALIAVAAIIIVIVGANIGGRLVKYDNSTVNSEFEATKSNIAVYTDAQAEYEAHNSKKEDLAASKTSKQQTLNSLNDFEAHQNERNTEIQGLLAQSSELETQVAEKQTRLDTLNAQITEEKNKPVVLPAGYYTVGTHIDAGRYVVTGKSNFVVYSSSGSLLVNTILGGGSWGVDSYTCNLSNGDIIEASGKDTYTRIN